MRMGFWAAHKDVSMHKFPAGRVSMESGDAPMASTRKGTFNFVPCDGAWYTVPMTYCAPAVIFSEK